MHTASGLRSPPRFALGLPKQAIRGYRFFDSTKKKEARQCKQRCELRLRCEKGVLSFKKCYQSVFAVCKGQGVRCKSVLSNNLAPGACCLTENISEAVVHTLRSVAQKYGNYSERLLQDMRASTWNNRLCKLMEVVFECHTLQQGTSCKCYSMEYI